MAPPSSLSYAFLLGLPEWLAGCRCCLPDRLTKLPCQRSRVGARRCHHFPRARLLGHTHYRTSRGRRWAGAATHCEGAQYCDAVPDHRTLHHRVLQVEPRRHVHASSCGWCDRLYSRPWRALIGEAALLEPCAHDCSPRPTPGGLVFAEVEIEICRGDPACSTRCSVVWPSR
ncbi:unnamed protein product [Urochloa humidicola]